MKRSALGILPLFLAAVFLACSSSPEAPVNRVKDVGPTLTPYVTSPSNVANNASNISMSGPEGLPNMAKGEDYGRLRYKMLDRGWSPARSKDGEANCLAPTDACKEFPELESGPAASDGRLVLRWKRGDKIARIYTAGDPPVYSRFEFEKGAAVPANKSASNSASNKKAANANAASPKPADDKKPPGDEEEPEEEPEKSGTANSSSN